MIPGLCPADRREADNPGPVAAHPPAQAADTGTRGEHPPPAPGPDLHMTAGAAYLIAITALAAIPFELARRVCGICGRILLRAANERGNR